MRSPVPALLLSVCGAVALEAFQFEPGPALPLRPLDVVLVDLDDVGTFDLEDDPTVATPNLDAFRASSARFARAYTTGPVCSASRVSALLGVYSRRQGIGRIIKKGDPNDVEQDAPTLADAFTRAGYRTCKVGKWHLSAGVEYPLEDAPELLGFEFARAVASHNLGATAGAGTYFSWGRIDDGVETVTTEYATAAQARAAREWWLEHEGEPRFLWLSFTAAHAPFHEAPAPYYTGPPTAGDGRLEFESMIEALDDRLGTVLEVLDPCTTLVVVSCDNGSAMPPPPPVPVFAKAGAPGVTELAIETPLYVRGPGIRPGARRQLVSVLDLWATLEELLGLPIPAPTDGVSFAGALVPWSSAPPREWLFAERFFPNYAPELGEPGPAGFNARERAIVRADGWKLRVDETGGAEAFRGLFHLPSDPLELAPVDDPALELELQALLDLFP